MLQRSRFLQADVVLAAAVPVQVVVQVEQQGQQVVAAALGRSGKSHSRDVLVVQVERRQQLTQKQFLRGSARQVTRLSPQQPKIAPS